MIYLLILAVAIELIITVPALAALPPEITVELFRAHPAPSRIVTDGPIRVMEPPNGVTLNGPHYEMRVAGCNVEVRSISVASVRDQMGAAGPALLSGRSITFKSTFRPTTIEVGEQRRSYAGAINLQVDRNGKLMIRNRVPAREYVYSVVGSETNPDFRSEALKAQAVLVQTLLARYRPGDDLTDTTEKQAYLGTNYKRQPAVQAVDDVWGKILTYRGLPITTYYHSTCAGGTSNGERYFGLKSGSAPYLAGRECRYCLASPFFLTKASAIPIGQFEKAFGKPLPKVIESDEQKRPLTVQIGNRTMNGFQFWTAIGQKFGWDKVPGTRYQISNKIPKFVEISSTGGGHGVGLCQWGANGLADKGKSYTQILEFYFPGGTIQDLK